MRINLNNVLMYAQLVIMELIEKLAEKVIILYIMKQENVSQRQMRKIYYT